MKSTRDQRDTNLITSRQDRVSQLLAKFNAVAGPIFETKNRAIFLERFFGRGISGEALLPLNFVPINWLWIHSPN